MPLPRDEVVRAALDWVWVPVDAVDSITAQYRLTLYPSRAVVSWSRAAGGFDALYDEVLAAARASGRRTLRWWVGEHSVPSDTGERLAGRGFTVTETLDVLALELVHGRLPAPPVAEGVEVTAVHDAASLDQADRLGTEVFGDPPSTPAQRAQALEQLAAEAEGERWSGRRYVATLAGRPVGTAGVSLAEGVARLWGGGVLPDARGQGVYRALLARRCADALVAGATAALVKGRIETSAPILRRAGFVGYGREVAYELRL